MDAVLGQVELPAFSDKPYGPPIKSYPDFDLTSSGRTTALGSLLPNDVAPTIAPFSLTAAAGTPKSLSADVSARCDVASYVWKFADGTTAYGASPVKTFSKPGTVTGQLKVVDTSGLSATRDFSVVVS
jgi:PKD repeat protein